MWSFDYAVSLLLSVIQSPSAAAEGRVRAFCQAQLAMVKTVAVESVLYGRFALSKAADEWRNFGSSTALYKKYLELQREAYIEMMVAGIHSNAVHHRVEDRIELGVRLIAHTFTTKTTRGRYNFERIHWRGWPFSLMVRLASREKFMLSTLREKDAIHLAAFIAPHGSTDAKVSYLEVEEPMVLFTARRALPRIYRPGTLVVLGDDIVIGSVKIP